MAILPVTREFLAGLCSREPLTSTVMHQTKVVVVGGSARVTDAEIELIRFSTYPINTSFYEPRY